jgi:hypothetical protein
MNTLKTFTILLAVGFAVGAGCGDDSTGKSPDAPVITSNGGNKGTDAGGMGGSGGSDAALQPDSPSGTGGAGGVDAPSGGDAPVGGATGQVDAGPDTRTVDAAAGEASVPLDGAGGEAAQATTICTGLSAAACDQAIRNAPVDPSVTAQDVPNTNPPAYETCSL